MPNQHIWLIETHQGAYLNGARKSWVNFKWIQLSIYKPALNIDGPFRVKRFGNPLAYLTNFRKVVNDPLRNPRRNYQGWRKIPSSGAIWYLNPVRQSAENITV